MLFVNYLLISNSFTIIDFYRGFLHKYTNKKEEEKNMLQIYKIIIRH